jgi:hypothetical protein
MQHREPLNKSPWLGIILIGLGVVFLISQLFNFNVFTMFNISWPLYILIPGALIMLLGLASGRTGTGFTTFGSVVTMTGLILLYQQTFNAFETWAYAWSLYPGAVGVALLLHHYRFGEPESPQEGLRLISVSVVLFIVFWTFFEMLIGLSGPRNELLSKLLGPALLIGVGAFLLRDQLFALFGKSKRDDL